MKEKINFRLMPLLSILSILTVFSYSKAQNLLDSQVLRPDKIVGAEEDSKIILNQPVVVRYNEYDNLVYVVDTKDNNLKIFDPDLNFIKTVGRFGQGPGEFNNPIYIVFDKYGKKYVGEFSNARIQIFDKDFNNIATINHRFRGTRDYFDVDSKGNIYTISNSVDDKIFLVYNEKGEIIEKFGEPLFNSNEGYNIEKFKKVYLNKFRFSIDKNNDIYCGFNFKPIVQKYDSNHNLVYQVDLSHLERAKKMKEYFKLSENYDQIRNYIMFLTTDEKYIYLQIRHPKVGHKDFNKVCILNKKDGKLVKLMNIQVNKEQKSEMICYIDPSHPEYIYFTDLASWCLARIKKNDIWKD